MKKLFEFAKSKMPMYSILHILVILPVLSVVGTNIDLEEITVIKGYIDPNIGAYIIVTLLGAMATIGYFCKSFVISIKNKILRKSANTESSDIPLEFSSKDER